MKLSVGGLMNLQEAPFRDDVEKNSKEDNNTEDHAHPEKHKWPFAWSWRGNGKSHDVRQSSKNVREEANHDAQTFSHLI